MTMEKIYIGTILFLQRFFNVILHYFVLIVFNVPMFTVFIGGLVSLVLCTIFVVVYIPVLYVFRKRAEFKSVLAYELMFWKGFTDFGQLIAFVISGIIAIFDWRQFPFFLNKLTGAVLYAFWFSMLFLSTITTFNRFVSVVFSSYYNSIFNRTNIRIVYALATFIFVIAVIEKMTPWSTYFFNVETLDWQYMPGDDWLLTVLSHNIGTYAILSEVLCAVIVYTVIFAHILSQKKRSMKMTEVVLTAQHFCVSLLYTFGFIYWSFVDVWASGNVMTNFLSNLTWILIIGLNPFIYLSVNKRLRKAVLVLIRISKDYHNQTITVQPRTRTALTQCNDAEQRWRTFMIAVKVTRR